MRFGVVGPLAGLLARPAQQPVIGDGGQLEHAADDVVAHRLHGTAHQPVVAGEVAGARGEHVQIRQQIGVRAAGNRIPVGGGEIVPGGLMLPGQHGAALPCLGAECEVRFAGPPYHAHTR